MTGLGLEPLFTGVIINGGVVPFTTWCHCPREKRRARQFHNLCGLGLETEICSWISVFM